MARASKGRPDVVQEMLLLMTMMPSPSHMENDSCKQSNHGNSSTVVFELVNPNPRPSPSFWIAVFRLRGPKEGSGWSSWGLGLGWVAAWVDTFLKPVYLAKSLPLELAAQHVWFQSVWSYTLCSGFAMGRKRTSCHSLQSTRVAKFIEPERPLTQEPTSSLR